MAEIITSEIEIQSGVISSGLTVDTGGIVTVLSGGTVTDAEAVNYGYFWVEEGGYISNILVTTSGEAFVNGSAENLTMESGGQADILGGVLNSAAILRPELISEGAERFGSQCIVVAIDARRRRNGSGWTIYRSGGRIDTGIDAVEWAVKAQALGAGEILLTSMDCDGTKAGYDIELTRTISDSLSIPVIASGGAGSLAHFYDALTAGGAEAALAASLFHYKELEIREVKEYLRDRGIPVRL